MPDPAVSSRWKPPASGPDSCAARRGPLPAEHRRQRQFRCPRRDCGWRQSFFRRPGAAVDPVPGGGRGGAANGAHVCV